MSVQTNVFDPRPSEQQHPAPGTGQDGHPQTAQADAAAVALVPDDQVKHRHAGQKPHHDREGITQVPPEAGRAVGEKHGLRGPGPVQQSQNAIEATRSNRNFASEVDPEAHMVP